MIKNGIINLKDIKSRYKNNPEPVEVGEARKLITESFANLEFVEDVHKYFLPVGKGKKIELPSVSHTIEQWCPKVDWDMVAEQKALNIGVPVEDLKEQWHVKNITATTNGSLTHFYGENLMNMFIGREDIARENMRYQYTYDDYLIPYCPKERAVMKYYIDILENGDIYPVMPEAKIHTKFDNPYFNILKPYAGTFDILHAYRYKGEIVFAIHDFKTNGDIYDSYARKTGKYMLPPFEDLFDEAYGHYAVQLSLYQIGLMQLGIKVVDRCLIWLKEDGSYEKVRTPDITDRLLKEIT